MSKTLITTTELAEALDAASLPHEHLWPASKHDVAVAIAKLRGAADIEQQMRDRQLTLIREKLSLADLKHRLEEAVADHRAYALSGDHTLLRYRHGVNRNATYYLSPRAYEKAITRRSARWREQLDRRAKEYATNELIHLHGNEYASLLRQFKDMTPEPDWYHTDKDDERLEEE
jgi:hypothetical protein